MKSLGIVVPAALLGLALSGCASSRYDAAPARMAGALPPESGSNDVASLPGQSPLQCVPYAREHSEVKLFGDAWTWWDQAAGKYARGASPAAGAVMVLYNYAGADHGHVAVVRRVVSAREIRVDHANWLDDGAIYVNDPVVDVSAANDWSQVRIWNIKTGGWGTKVFPVQGFIGPGGAMPTPPPANDNDPALEAVIASLTANDPGRAAPVRVPVPAAAPSPIAPVAETADDRNPPPDSGHALTDEDRAIP